jgi:hypothetical protein
LHGLGLLVGYAFQKNINAAQSPPLIAIDLKLPAA